MNDQEGKWNGLIRALLEDRGDIVVTSLKITPDRSSAILFSVPFLETGITIAVTLKEGSTSPIAFLGYYRIYFLYILKSK